MRKAAVLYTKFLPKHIELLKRENPEVQFDLFPGPGAFSEKDAPEYEIILGGVSPALLPQCRRLGLLQLNSAGVDGYTDPTLYAHPDIVLCNASGAYGLAISECLVGMHLGLIKKNFLYRDQMKEHLWKDGGKVTSIYGSTIVVLGTGDIGSAYARLVRAFSPYLIGVRRTAVKHPDFDRTVSQQQLDEVLPLADAVVCTLPGTKSTHHILDAKRLSLMKKGAILLNIGRGSAIDPDALLAALQSGHLGGAALDVTEPEPLPPKHPLWDAPNLFLTPHITGLDHLSYTVDAIARIASRHIGQYVRGEPIPDPVNLREGY